MNSGNASAFFQLLRVSNVTNLSLCGMLRWKEDQEFMNACPKLRRLELDDPGLLLLKRNACSESYLKMMHENPVSLPPAIDVVVRVSVGWDPSRIPITGSWTLIDSAGVVGSVVDGAYHAVGRPARTHPTSPYEEWCIHGVRHRMPSEGPALISHDGITYYYVHGKKLDKGLDIDLDTSWLDSVV